MRTVAALYVETNGVYYNIPDIDPWDIERDAMLYDGPFPIVAHPPCGPWGALRKLSYCQNRFCGPRAVEQVREFGGVLEHPAYSTLFRYCGLPFPGEGYDKFGGLTYTVNQVSWGHKCIKATWLYVVKVPTWIVGGNLRFGGRATHRIGNKTLESKPELPQKLRSTTPIAFRDFLITIAQSVYLTEASTIGIE